MNMYECEHFCFLRSKSTVYCQLNGFDSDYVQAYFGPRK